MSQASFTGPGTVALAPTLMGDIVALQIANDGKVWNVGKDAFLACTGEVDKDTKSQGFSKAMFSGEDLFIYKMMGQGLVWLTSYGAVDVIHVSGLFLLFSFCLVRFSTFLHYRSRWTSVLILRIHSSRKASSILLTMVTWLRGIVIIRSRRLPVVAGLVSRVERAW